jgi:DNA invertase Pin-like site-specific DNA recombinase
VYLDFAREGDMLVVTKLDRLARSTLHLCTIAEELGHKGGAAASRSAEGFPTPGLELITLPEGSWTAKTG